MRRVEFVTNVICEEAMRMFWYDGQAYYHTQV